MMASRVRRHRWALDFSGRSKSDHQVSRISDLRPPVGYSETANVSDRVKDIDPDLIVKRSWDVALGPVKQVPMNIIIMWMAGNSISIFPIMMVGMMFFRPIQALIGIQNTFKLIEGYQGPLQKIVYFFGNVICLALAVYKCQVMGLLPTQPSDWLAFVEPQKRMEWSGGGILL
ncbi:ER membrane protein complex subunit 4 [Octopus bimaculoides]|uniref:ER membrane protein complex subunit 4 n=1 Tax=Octopus bimaculoides TaxID=37653 RepID=A0A0L8G191_OCTBM|nr:ER membrane protein complex subunit 4 [Octopus bimaculoides]|eukprot:XP_014785082.1 PREDICTED: ER membrane protein complex subunit 4-like [Octopus bimaculoides]